MRRYRHLSFAAAAVGFCASSVHAEPEAASEPEAPIGLPDTVFSRKPALMQTPPPAPHADAVEPGAPADAHPLSRFSLQLNLDVTNAYFFRGIRQEDRGVMFQPAAKLTFNLVQENDLKLDAFATTWNSIHTRKTLAEDKDAFPGHWYELDGTGGLALTLGKWTITGEYLAYTSPSNAFEPVQEIDLTLALDDSEWLGAFSLKPYIQMAREIGANGTDTPEGNNGSYLELGIGPGFVINADKTPVTFTFPLLVGISLGDYYEDASGNDHTFGYVQLGGEVRVPLPIDKRFGDWSVSAGVYGLFLGDHARIANNGDRTQMLGTVGIQVGF
jgi:hypothetical protein